MTLLPTVQGTLERLAQILRLDGGDMLRRLVQVGAIWVLAYLALRLTRLAAQRIEGMVDDGDPSIVTLREKRGAR